MIKITNSGNGAGGFTWKHTLNKIFTVAPESAIVPPNNSIDVLVTYKP